MNEEDELKIFTKILSFVNEYKNVFAEDPILKYYKLLKKTPVANTTAIKNHINIFKNWLTYNRDAILQKNKDNINGILNISANVYLPIKDSLDKADQDTTNSIFKHLLIIFLRIFPDDEAIKTALVTDVVKAKPQPPSGNEGDFLNKFMSKIENNFSETEFTDPMSATMHMLNSGIFTEMVGSMNTEMQSGNLDLTKLLGSVQGMLGNLGASTNIGSGGIEGLSGLGGLAGLSGGDMSGMMSMVSGLMSNMNLQSPPPE